MPRLKQLRASNQLQQVEAAKYIRDQGVPMDTGQLSRLENYICLPTPEVMEALCAVYNVEPNSLYEYAEVDLGVKRPKKKDKRKPHFKITVRVPLEYANLDKLHTMTRACGYSGLTGWVLACIKRLEGEYGARKKNRSDIAVS